jgi:hypothetical protein
MLFCIDRMKKAWRVKAKEAAAGAAGAGVQQQGVSGEEQQVKEEEEMPRSGSQGQSGVIGSMGSSRAAIGAGSQPQGGKQAGGNFRSRHSNKARVTSQAAGQ